MMAGLKKNAVWLALILTLAACAWFKWQDLTAENEAELASAKVAVVALANNKSVVITPLTRVRPDSLPGSAGYDQLMANQVSTLLRPQLVPAQAPIKNLFSVYQPPQTDRANETVTAPQVPANPYNYAGELIEAGNTKVFLTDGTNNHAVQLGDVLDGTWRVQAISTLAVSLMYLPLKTIVTLPKGALN